MFNQNFSLTKEILGVELNLNKSLNTHCFCFHLTNSETNKSEYHVNTLLHVIIDFCHYIFYLGVCKANEWSLISKAGNNCFNFTFLSSSFLFHYSLKS